MGIEDSQELIEEIIITNHGQHKRRIITKTFLMKYNRKNNSSEVVGEAEQRNKH